MKRSLLLIAALAAFPAVAHASDKESFRVKDENAFASWYGTGACVFTAADVGASKAAVKEGPGGFQPQATVWLSLWSYDACNDTWWGAWGQATLDASDYVQSKLDTASLSKTLEVCDIDGVCSKATVQVNWTGTGDVYTGRNSWGYSGPGYKVHGHGTGTDREADATGTVSVGAAPYASGPADWAHLGKSQSGVISITH